MCDITSCLGYVNGYERFWSGALVGKYGSKEFVVQVMGHNILVHEDEYIIDAPQLHGMSGAAVINGLYYTGCVHVAHRLGRDHYTSLSSVVIPAMHIINFAKLHFDKLSSLSSCPGTTVLQVIVWYLLVWHKHVIQWALLMEEISIWLGYLVAHCKLITTEWYSYSNLTYSIVCSFDLFISSYFICIRLVTVVVWLLSSFSDAGKQRELSAVRL